MKNLAIKKLVGFSIFGLMIFGCAYNVKEEKLPFEQIDKILNWIRQGLNP